MNYQREHVAISLTWLRADLRTTLDGPGRDSGTDPVHPRPVPPGVRRGPSAVGRPQGGDGRVAVEPTGVRRHVGAAAARAGPTDGARGDDRHASDHAVQPPQA